MFENNTNSYTNKQKNITPNKPYQITNISLFEQVVYITPLMHTFENSNYFLVGLSDRS